MNARRLPVLIALLLLTAGCGTSGNGQTQPIEVLYYVSGGPGLRFRFIADPEPDRCGSNTTGIQSANASHQFGDRVFQTPHLFVLENDRQPVRAAIENIPCDPDDPSCVDGPLRVDLYLGMTPQQSNVIINEGECRTVSQPGVFPPPTAIPTPSKSPRPTATPVTFTAPDVSGRLIQVEVCSPLNGDGDPALRTPCIADTPQPSTTPEPPATPGATPTGTPGDRDIAYFATIGDIKASVISNCLLPPILDACRSPSTFFFEQPKDEISAVMSVNSGQNPNGEPTAEVRLELYIDGTRVDSDAGTDPIVDANL